MKTFSILITLLLAATSASIVEKVMDNCLVDKQEAKKLLEGISSFGYQNLDQSDLEDLPLHERNAVQQLIGVLPGAGNAIIGTLAKSNEVPDVESVLYGFLDQLIIPKEEVPDLQDDWDECTMDLEYYLKPLKATAKCAVLTYIKESSKIGRWLPAPKKSEKPIQKWALQMLDASFKPPPGLVSGKLHWPGDYEMCTGISANYSSIVGYRDISGSYCRVNIGPSKNNSLPVSLAVGVCLPSTCASMNITEHINSGDFSVGSLVSMGLEIKEITCDVEHHIASDNRGLVALVITLFLALLALIAAIYDGLFRKARIQRAMDQNSAPVHEPEVGCVESPQRKDLAAGIAPPTISEKLHYVNVHPGDYRRFSLGGGEVFLSSTDIKVSTVPTPQVQTFDDCRETHQGLSYETYLNQSANFLDRIEVAFVGFSALNSMKNIFSPRKTSEIFRSCNGIRFLSFCYSMLGMTYVLGIIHTETFTTGNLISKMLELRKKLFFQPVINFTLAIDSFLVLSGFLVTYKWLKQVSANGGKMSIGMLAKFYLHRYWSLMPAFMLVTMFYTCLYEYFTTGPMVPPQITDAENCRANWWTNLFMVSNLVDVENACMSWTWYIPMVFQLHIITPVILIPLLLYFVAGCLVLVLLLMVQIGVTAMISISLYENFGFHDWYYNFVMVPWTKAGAYFVGVALGIVLFKVKDRKINIHPVLSFVGWAISIVLVCLVSTSSMPIFSSELEEGESLMTANFQLNKIDAVLLRTLGHTAWAVAVAWMIFASETGHGGYLRRFLRWNAFGPLSRMTFMAFLVSAIMIIRNTLVQVSLIYVTLNNMLYFLVGNIVIALIVGLVLGLAFRHPFVGLEKAFTIKTKRDAILIASNPLTPDAEEDEMAEVCGTVTSQSRVMYDNVTFDSKHETPPPVYKRFLDKNDITTEL